MIQNYKSFLLVWFLALLQCFVPLLHAHAGGLHVSGGAHIHLDALHVGVAHDHTEFRTDLCDAPAVSAPSEFKRDLFFSGDGSSVAVATIPQPTTLAVALRQAGARSYFPGFHKTNPPAQAPPASSRFL